MHAFTAAVSYSHSAMSDENVSIRIPRDDEVGLPPPEVEVTGAGAANAADAAPEDVRSYCAAGHSRCHASRVLRFELCSSCVHSDGSETTTG